MSTSAAVASNPQPAVDFSALKARQQSAWSSGDYAIVGTTLQIVGESLCEALDLRAGSKVLDVAAGNGNGALAAARRWCEVTATDYVPALLERGQERAKADRLPIVLNICPMKPSGVQFARPTEPPRLQTRMSSDAARSWSGVNITPKIDSTLSKD